MEYLLITVVCFVIFYRSLFYGLVVDDDRTHAKPRYIYTKKDCRFPLIINIRRTLDGNQPIRNVFLDHCLTLFLHTLACLLIYWTFGRLDAALLFAVNVSNNGGSLWLNGKRFVVNTILCLLTFKFAPYGILFWLLTPFFQASAIVLPVMFLFKGYWQFLVFMPLVLLFGRKVLLSHAKYRLSLITVKEFIRFTPRKIFLILKTFGFYFIRGIIPFPPIMYISYLSHFGLIGEQTEEGFRFDLLAFIGLLIIVCIPTMYCKKSVHWVGIYLVVSVHVCLL